jgi:ketosteroid isomerase-like protein
VGAKPNAIEAVVGWMDAMRRGDLHDVAGWFHPDVTWTGAPGTLAVCRNRDDVMEMLRNSLAPCPEDPQADELEEGLRGALAVELIAASTGTVVLGAKVPGMSEIGGVEVGGQIYNVFRVRDGRIAAVADYALREEALQAVGATPPDWR